uniref:C-type lectin domain-containing protein n=1 Tax=Anas platyrhynchos TaxID=8839 RepID=A0A8B9SI11_ANAPL
MESKCSEAGVPVVLPLLAADCHPPARFFLLPWLLSLWSGTVKNLFVFFLSFFYLPTRVLTALQAGERLELCPLLPSFALRCSGSVAHGLRCHCWLSQRAYSCPPSWIGFKGKCFYFSDGEKNQTLSRADCHARNASLAVIQSREELDFMMRYKGSHDHWIGLSRQNPRQRWEWDDGTEFDSSLFPIGGGEDFAFLNNQRVTSARSSGERHWICTRQP